MDQKRGQQCAKPLQFSTSGSGKKRTYGDATEAAGDAVLLSSMSKAELHGNLEVLGVDNTERESLSKAALQKMLLNKSFERLNLNLSRKGKADTLNKTELQKILQRFGFR